MDGFDMGSLGNLMNMFGGLQEKAEALKASAASHEVTGEAGGVVKVRMTCDQQVQGVEISAEALGDKEMLEDLVRAATNEALRQAKEHVATQMKQLAGGLPIPPGLIPGM